MKIAITRFGLLISMKQIIDNIGLEAFAKIKDKLRINHTYKVGRIPYHKSILLYKIVKIKSNGQMIDCFRIARFSNIVDRFKKIKPDINITYRIDIIPGKEIMKTEEPILKDHQVVCTKHMMEKVYTKENVDNGKASCIFVMDTGQGKTYVASYMIHKFNKKTLIIIPNTNNLDGWHTALKKCLPSLKIGEYHTDIKSDGDVVIMTINSSINDEFNFKTETGRNKISSETYFQDFGFIIFDEIHDYPTETRQEIFWRTNFQYVLGLTATPNERTDCMDPVYYNHVGPILYAKEIPGFLELAKDFIWKGEVSVLDYYGPPEFTKKYTNSMGTTDMVAMYKQLALDPHRTKMLVDQILTLKKEKRNIFVFAIHKQFLQTLKKDLVESGLDVLVPELDSGIAQMSGGIDPVSKLLAETKADVILITYGYGKQSLSIPKMDTLILAQSLRNKTRQLLGRILRQGGDTSIVRKIVDVRDMKVSLKSQFDTRNEIYEEKEFTIKHTKVKFEEWIIN